MGGVSATEMIGNLPEATVDSLEVILRDLPKQSPAWMLNRRLELADGTTHHMFGPEVETSRRDDVNLQKMIRSYKGIRHERGQKVRGQRTRSNGRTGMAAGVLKKAAKEAAAEKAAEGGAEKAPAATEKTAEKKTGAAAPAAAPAEKKAPAKPAA